MPTGLEERKWTSRQEQMKSRKILIFSILLFIALFFFSLCIRNAYGSLLPPLEVLKNLAVWIKLIAAQLFDLPLYRNKDNIIAAHPTYFETVYRFKITVLIIVAGVILSISGAVFQVVFRNPIAAPSMLGVTNGVSLGILILVLQYSTFAANMVKEKYIYCYSFSAVILVIVILAGRFVGKNRTSVTDMLLVGAIISQIINTVIAYFQFQMPENLLLAYQEISMGKYISTSDFSFQVLLGVSLIGIVPVFLARFSLNAVSFEDSDAYAMGVNPKIMRTVTLLAGTVLMTAAMIHCGNIGMLSLIVPHFARYTFGSNFKSVYHACILYGGIIMMICLIISSLVTYGAMGNIPISSIVSLIATPIFVVILLQKRRGWE